MAYAWIYVRRNGDEGKRTALLSRGQGKGKGSIFLTMKRMTKLKEWMGTMNNTCSRGLWCEYEWNRSHGCGHTYVLFLVFFCFVAVYFLIPFRCTTCCAIWLFFSCIDTTRLCMRTIYHLHFRNIQCVINVHISSHCSRPRTVATDRTFYGYLHLSLVCSFQGIFFIGFGVCRCKKKQNMPTPACYKMAVVSECNPDDASARHARLWY